MKRRNFLNSFALSMIGLSNYAAIKLPFKNFNKKIKITLTPWSLIRSGYGGNDPLNIDLLEFPKVAKSLGFNFIDHEMFHYPPNLKPKSFLDIRCSPCHKTTTHSFCSFSSW